MTRRPALQRSPRISAVGCPELAASGWAGRNEKSTSLKAQTNGLRSEAKLQITSSAFCKEQIRPLIDDLIVPALVEEFLRTKVNLRDSSGHEHNEGHL